MTCNTTKYIKTWWSTISEQSDLTLTRLCKHMIDMTQIADAPCIWSNHDYNRTYKAVKLTKDTKLAINILTQCSKALHCKSLWLAGTGN